VAVLRAGLGGPFPPDFWMAPAWLPQFCAKSHIQVRLTDICSRKLSASKVLNDDLEALLRAFNICQMQW